MSLRTDASLLRGLLRAESRFTDAIHLANTSGRHDKERASGLWAPGVMSPAMSRHRSVDEQPEADAERPLLTAVPFCCGQILPGFRRPGVRT